MKKYAMGHKKEVIAGGILCLQLLVIIVYNLTMLRYQADYDSSSGMLQMVEIWRKKTLLIPDWEYQTTVGWDIPLLFAVPFYGITKNVFLSLGIANNLFVIVYVLLIFDILKKNNVSTGNRFVALIALFTPYTVGQLGYLPMMFIGTASYVVKVLIPLLLIDVILELEQGTRVKKMIVRLVFLVLFSVLSGISSGVYMLACGVFPVMFYLVLRVLRRNSLKLLYSKPMIITVVTAAAFGVGIVAARILAFENHSTSMQLLPGTKLAENALHCFVGIWELFGAVRENVAPQVLSKDGFICLFGVLITALILFSIVYYAIRVLLGKEKRTAVGIVLCINFVNMCVLLLTETTYSAQTFEYRYHVVAMIPSMLLLGMFVQEITQKWNTLSRRTALVMIVFACIAISASNFNNLYAEADTGIINELSKITDLARKHNVGLIYVNACDEKSMEAGRILRVSDFDQNVVTITAENRAVGWGASMRYFENGQYEGRIMVMSTDQNWKKLPPYLTGKMEKIGKVLNYRLYLCDENIIDCSTKLPAKPGEKSVDFPYSPWYTIYGNINDSGELEVGKNKDIVMYGSLVEPVDGKFRIRLAYRLDAASGIKKGQKAGTFGIYSADDDIKGQVDIIAGEECVLDDVTITEDMGMLHYSVVSEPDSGLVLQSITVENRTGKNG